MKYLCDPQIIPAVMPESLAQLIDSAARAAEYAQWLHVDVMDGEFAPNPQWRDLGELEGRTLPDIVRCEVHLMTAAPRELGESFAKARAQRVMAHIEAFADAKEAATALRAWKEAGAVEAGLAIKLDTPLPMLKEAVEACDFLQVMSIAQIGFQGTPFDESAISRVEELHAMYPDMMVGVDGGVSEGNVEELVRAGANRLVVGGALAKSADPAKTFAEIHERAMRGCMPLQVVGNRE